MSAPFWLRRAHDRGVRESRRFLLKYPAVYADADNRLPELQPIWQDSANSWPRRPTIAAPSFLVEESPVSSLAVILLELCATQITKSHVILRMKRFSPSSHYD